MKKIFTILLVFLCGYAQSQNIWQPSLGEYCTQIFNTSTKQLYDIGFAAGAFYPTVTATGVASPGAGAHGETYVDASGYVWGKAQANTAGEYGPTNIGGSIANWTRINVDSSGAAFNNVKISYVGFDQTFWIKNDGTLWVAGNVSEGLRGDGVAGTLTAPNPVQIKFPAGVLITQISMAGCGACQSTVAVALDNSGNVWTWGGNGNFTTTQDLGQSNSSANGLYPVKITTFGGTITQVSAANFMHFALRSDGHLFAWGWYNNYAGTASCCGLFGNTPQDITSVLNIPGTIREIGGCWTTEYALTTANTLWAWGDQVIGAFGSGVTANWAAPQSYEGPSPYAYGFWGNCDMHVAPAVQIAPGYSNFAHIWTNGPYLPFVMFTDNTTNGIFVAGRNKVGVLFNGVINADEGTYNLDAVYPDSWDVPWITRIPAPGTISAPIKSSSPYCVTNPSGSPCNIYSIPVTAAPNCSAGSTQNISSSSTTLLGVVSGNGGSTVIYQLWRQTSGPNTAVMPFPSDVQPAISGLITGTYTFSLADTDNNWRANSANVTVNVNMTGPVANAGANQSITLPTNSVTLNGSLSTGSISSYLWTLVSGPNAPTITTPTTVTTTVTGMIQGTYVFQLSLNGGVSTATTQVVVNQAIIANAGSNQTITLPTNSVTLNGSASTGAITSYLWTQLSGPNSATLATPNSVTTTASGLIQGSYVFRLSVNGGVSTSNVTITVNASNVIANAGSNQTIMLPTSSVSLSGSLSTGTITSYLWTQISGPNTASITTPTTVNTTVTGLIASGVSTAGVYVFQLSLNGGVSTAQVTITVNPQFVANAGANQIITLPTSSVILNGSASTGVGLTYVWTLVSGPNTPTIVTPTVASTSVTGLTDIGPYTAGVYVFQLSLNGGASVATTQVTVNPAPPACNSCWIFNVNPTIIH